MTLQQRLDLAAVVVTFRPAADVRPRLLRYAGFFGHVFVIDNTDGSPGFTDLEGIDHLSYHPQLANLGVAEGLNIGIREAASHGFAFVMLLDQDSAAQPQAVALAAAACASDIGIVAMLPVLPGRHPTPATAGKAVRDVPMAMTSGSILSIAAFTACGPLDPALFIDYVDYEYCLRLRRHGLRVVECPVARLEHALGAPKTARVLGRHFRYVSHPPFRSYYRVRNGLQVALNYLVFSPAAAFDIGRVLTKELVKALFIEDDRRLRLGYMLKGFSHWVQGRSGSLAGN